MFPTRPLSKTYLAGFVNARILRDNMKRQAFAENEQLRNALRYDHFSAYFTTKAKSLTAGDSYISQNTQLPSRQRALAQLQLSQMHSHTRSTQFKNRCILAGKGRGVFRDFRLGRVS
jgi:small subunit ribosomal protein S14